MQNGNHDINNGGGTSWQPPTAIETTRLLHAMSSFSSDMTTSSIRSIRPLPGMKIRSHAIDTKGSFQACPTKEAISKGKARKGVYWVDVDADERDENELRQWLSQLKLSSFLAERLAQPPHTWSSQVLPFQTTTVLAIIRILPQEQASDELSHMAILLIYPSLLLTFTSCPRCETGVMYSQVVDQMQARGAMNTSNVMLFLLRWLQFHIERTSFCVRELRGRVLKMDENMDLDISECDLETIILAKNQLLRLLSVAEEQHECLEALSDALNGCCAAFRNNSQQHEGPPSLFGVLLATAGATERMALRLEKHLSELRHRHECHQQERTNRRLAALTVLSAVFLPLTLVTGIWGMNFEHMPELAGPNAYPIALTCMLFGAICMVCYFKRSGWLE